MKRPFRNDFAVLLDLNSNGSGHCCEEAMSKSHDTKKDKKKPAQKTAKEKKLAKREKKKG
jgi:hypothetical protein